MLPNQTQVLTSTSALVGVAAGYAAGQHWLGLGVDQWTTVIGALFMAATVVGPAIVTRLQSLKNTVGNSGALVVTSAASAKGLPNNPNVVTAAEVTPTVLAQAAKRD